MSIAALIFMEQSYISRGFISSWFPAEALGGGMFEFGYELARV